MHGMTDILGQVGIPVALLLQRGHDPREDLWEPEVLLLILFLGGLVAVVAWLVVRIVPRFRGDERPEAPRDSAEEILRERFARGEISAEEFQRSIEILRGGSGDHHSPRPPSTSWTYSESCARTSSAPGAFRLSSSRRASSALSTAVPRSPKAVVDLSRVEEYIGQHARQKGTERATAAASSKRVSASSGSLLGLSAR